MSILRQYENFYEKIQPAQESSEEAFVWFSDVPHWLLNVVMHLSCEDVEDRVDTLIKKAPVGNPLSFWLHPENRAEGLQEILQARGFASIITCPLMYWSVGAIATTDVDIRPAEWKAFMEILCAVYGFDSKVATTFEAMMRRVDSENYMIFEDGLPIGTGTLLIDGSVGGIFNDATLGDRREAPYNMMRFLMRRAHELNLKQLILLSSPEGEELYQHLGFNRVMEIEIYCRQNSF